MEWMNHTYMEQVLSDSKAMDLETMAEAIERAKAGHGLTLEEVAHLLQITDETLLQNMYQAADVLKQRIYGNRIVLFAPLYVSDYCVNNCVYCGYKRDNTFNRRKLNRAEIQEEVRLLEKMGHKRIALEVGEDPVNFTIDDVLEAIDAVYTTFEGNGAIRRMNVNIAATTVENYTQLKGAKIGTYILFQETYHRPTYEAMHPRSLKGNYEYHLTAFDRAMEAGLDDVGAGVLFGLYKPEFEVLGLMLHNQHLEKHYGVGFHTVSVPRLKAADGMRLENFPYLVDDSMFKKIVAILRLALPFTGLILSTRETPNMRQEVLRYGVSQISAGSCTGVGGYLAAKHGQNQAQFSVNDHREPIEVLKALMADGHVPSYCTACYRSGRTGDRFMALAKSGEIQNVCQPNALMTLLEFMMDYGDEALKEQGEKIISQGMSQVPNEAIRKNLEHKLQRIRNGERDLFM